MVTKYAHLPREAVCVENLAPWLKQLPCRERGGFARALRSAHDVFGAEHLTFGVRARVVGDRLSIEQTLMMALPSASTAFANAKDALSRAEDARCVATDRSLLHVRGGDSLKTYEMGVDEFPESMDGETSFRAPTLFVERFFTGTGNEAGGVVLDLERANWGGGEFNGRAPVRVRLFQTFPWFVKMYLHTLAVEIDGSVGEPRHGSTKATYVVHNEETGAVTIREVDYDVERTCRAILEVGLPEVFAWRLSHGFEYAERADDASHVCER